MTIKIISKHIIFKLIVCNYQLNSKKKKNSLKTISHLYPNNFDNRTPQKHQKRTYSRKMNRAWTACVGVVSRAQRLRHASKNSLTSAIYSHFLSCKRRRRARATHVRSSCYAFISRKIHSTIVSIFSLVSLFQTFT